MGRSRTVQIVRWIEGGLVIIGATCLLWAGATSLSAIVYQVGWRASLEERAAAPGRPDADRGPLGVATRVEATAPIGRIEIPRLGLSAVVAEGDDEKTLTVAVGHLPDTPFPWQAGNSALAGHRDSFFLPLRRIQVGDDIHFRSAHGTFRYRVTRYTVVEPDELWVLDASPSAALTLITCYPFDVVGAAPRRFVVHAERIANPDESGNTRPADHRTFSQCRGLLEYRHELPVLAGAQPNDRRRRERLHYVSGWCCNTVTCEYRELAG
jgi:sortase A